MVVNAECAGVAPGWLPGVLYACCTRRRKGKGTRGRRQDCIDGAIGISSVVTQSMNLLVVVV